MHLSTEGLTTFLVRYESIKTVTVPPAKDRGQLGGSAPGTAVADSAADLQTEDQKRVRGEQTAGNIRYGQAISEQGMGGETKNIEGSASNQGKQATGIGRPSPSTGLAGWCSLGRFGGVC